MAFGEKFYLIGGRGILPVNEYDPHDHVWTTKKSTPIEMHHFQPVVYQDAIYIVGAMTGNYPTENPLPNIYVYDPVEDQWIIGDKIPESRRRGAGGMVVHDNIMYFIGGIQHGHTSGTVAWADAYNPATGEWEILPDAPRVRDHFMAVCVDGKIYCIGGRNTSYHEPGNFTAFFAATIAEVDVFDTKTRRWTTLPAPLPVPSAAGGIALLHDHIVYMGGESGQEQAHKETQALDMHTGKWTLLEPLLHGRHGTMALAFDDKIYFAAGSGNKGGGDLTTLQVFANNLGWSSLFNGENLEGWVVKCVHEDRQYEYWSVMDANIVCNSMNAPPKDYVWLLHENAFSDFELKLQFKAYKSSQGNSGVQIRSRYHTNFESTGGWWLDGPQVDIDLVSPWRTGLLYDETWEERRWISPNLPNWEIDSLHAPPKVIFFYAEDTEQWNDLVILCKANTIKTFLNNIPVTDFDGTGVLDKLHHQVRRVGQNGHIALQLHAGDRIYIRFRDIMIRTL